MIALTAPCLLSRTLTRARDTHGLSILL
jgi:hypothetical protein